MTTPKTKGAASKAPAKKAAAKKAPAKKASAKKAAMDPTAVIAVYLMKMATALVAMDKFIDAIRPMLPSDATDEADAVKAAVNDVLTVGQPAAKDGGAAHG